VRAAYDIFAKTAAVHDLIRWVLPEGPQYAKALRDVPPADNLVHALLAELEQRGR
jgi:hypothetical protein